MSRRDAFEVIPAIDLRGGRVVRLVGGDFGRETVYGEDAAAVGRAFARAGAHWLHLVDLDGARRGRPQQLDAVGTVVAAIAGTAARVELGGGLRSPRAVEEARERGIARVVIGTAALDDPALVASLAGRDDVALAVALDVRDGVVVGEAWRDGARRGDPGETLARLAAAGVQVFEVTAIERDGALVGPDLALLERLAGSTRAAVIASGGIRSLDDLRAVRDAGCAGAIVGRALYEGRLELAEALAAFDPRD